MGGIINILVHRPQFGPDGVGLHKRIKTLTGCFAFPELVPEKIAGGSNTRQGDFFDDCLYYT